MLRGGFALVFAFALVVLSSSSATAQRDRDELARAHFQSGSAYFEIGDYEAAIREFEAAYRVSPRDLLLYNLYLAHERLGHHNEAFGYLERYLAADPDIPDEERHTLALRLENLRARLADDEPAATPPPPPPEPTVVVVQVPVETPEPAVEPEPEPELQTAETPPEEAEPAETESNLNIGGITSFTVAGAGLGIMITAGAMAWKQDRQLAENCTPSSTVPCSEEDRQRLSTLTKTADIGLIIAGLGLVSGILFYVLDRDDEDDEGADVAVSPWFGRSGAGVAAQGSF